ncbi:MAG: hypothetical protein ACRERX_23500, partial [Pseudomonas sp.]
MRKGTTSTTAAVAAGVADANTLSAMMFHQLGVRPSSAREWTFGEVVERWWHRNKPVRDCNHVCEHCAHLFNHVPSCPPEALWVGTCSTCERGGQPAADRMARNKLPPRRRARVGVRLNVQPSAPGATMSRDRFMP